MKKGDHLWRIAKINNIWTIELYEITANHYYPALRVFTCVTNPILTSDNKYDIIQGFRIEDVEENWSEKWINENEYFTFSEKLMEKTYRKLQDG